MATKEQIRKIYTLGSELGIKGRGHEDLLHELVSGITGKRSIKDLTESEVKEVMSELYKRKTKPAPKKSNTDNAELGSNGMATPSQQRLCWRYCYRLKELDPNKESAGVFKRLEGAIKKVCGTNIIPQNDPFRCVTQQEAAKLIEQLKRYVNTAEKQKKREGDNVGT